MNKYLHTVVASVGFFIHIGSNIQVVVGVFSITAAYFFQSCCACLLCTVQNETQFHSAQCTINKHNRTERNMQP